MITKGLDSLGNPPQNISDIYIAFVLSKNYSNVFNKFLQEFANLDQII